MKTNAFLTALVIFFAGLSFYFYNQSKQVAVPEPKVEEAVVLPTGITQNTTPITEDTLHLDHAQYMVEKWNTEVLQSQNSNPLYNKPIRAFDIPHADVTNIFSNTNAATFRAYLGIDSLGEYKVALVGVDAAGNDLINYTGPPQGREYVYDLSTPCPTICDTASPLYTGKTLQ